MRLPLDAGRFLARLSVWFAGWFLVWLWFGPWYTRLLAALSGLTVSWLDRPTVVWSEGTSLFFWPRGIPLPHRPPAIAAEWIQANSILLLALMAATPAPDRTSKAKRLAVAVGLLLAWQLCDILLAIKFGYATQLDPTAYTERARYFYAFATNLAMYVDTQIIPFAIWAGIHFRELVARASAAAKPPRQSSAEKPLRQSSPAKPVRKRR